MKWKPLNVGILKGGGRFFKGRNVLKPTTSSLVLGHAACPSPRESSCGDGPAWLPLYCWWTAGNPDGDGHLAWDTCNTWHLEHLESCEAYAWKHESLMVNGPCADDPPCWGVSRSASGLYGLWMRSMHTNKYGDALS